MSGWPDGMEMIRRVREAAGLFAGAMSITPQQAFEEALDRIRQMREAQGQNEVRLDAEHAALFSDLQDAQTQLAYWWHDEKRCPCGARKGSPDTHPHVLGCPTEKAIRGRG